MRTRWIVLAAIAGTALAFAVVLLALGYMLAWLDVVGLAVAFGIGLVTTFQDYRKRWPAAFALIAVAPLLMSLVPTTGFLFGFGMHGLLMLYAVGGIAVSSLTILLASIPGPQADRVPPARLVR